MRTKIKKILKSNKEDVLEKYFTVYGFVKTIRIQKTFAFIEVNDGSIFSNLQVVVNQDMFDFEKIKTISTAASISVYGKIVQSPNKKQNFEMQAKKIKILGLCFEDYPLQKKRHSFEFLRTISHLRPRTNTQGAVLRVRNALSYATHIFFQERGFLYVPTPIITSSDCEGAGEMFQVTTLLNEKILKEKKIDFSKDFFSTPTYLTVSGQLNAEIFVCGLCDVYTFGPTFRAENSNTSRHLSEFWMIEPEMAFVDLNESIKIAEEYLKYIIKYVLENNEEDISFFNQFIEKGLLEKLQLVVNEDFGDITYTEAIEILEKSKQKFEFPIKWGVDLQSEHEKYLSEIYFKRPIIVRDYPKEIKAFYMRENEDKKTVAAMDILVPKIGEIIGGSQREERLDVLKRSLKEKKLNEKDYWWYLDLRKYGSVYHSGFGLGLERLIQFVTGMENIRDVIPFPRYPGHAKF